MKAPEAIGARYILYFNESLRGLTVGAPVMLLGLPAGEVTAVGLDVDPRRRTFEGERRSSPIPSGLPAACL